MSNEITLTTPPGRIVQGSLYTPNTTDMKGQPLVYKSGENKGQPRVEYYIGLAIPKNDPGVGQVFQAMQQVAQASFPGGQSNQADFAWKYYDGDHPDHANKEGFPGHYVIKMSTGYAPNIYDRQNQRMVDENAVKRGDYVRVSITIKGNGSPTLNPGILINMNMVQFLGYGQEIVSGPSAEDVFGDSSNIALPPGASATPVAPAGGMPSTGVPGAPAGMPTVGAAPGGMPAAGAAPGGMPAAGAAPAGMPGLPGAASPQPGAVSSMPPSGTTLPGNTGTTPSQPHTDILTPPGMPQ